MDTTWEHTAARQFGLVTWEQLSACGVSARQISGLVERRVLRRSRRRVYAVVGAPPSWKQSLLSSVLSAGGQAVASHAAAARLWRFRYTPEDRLELTVLRPRFVDLVGVKVHRTKILDGVDTTRREGIPCTTFERTLCDVTGVLSEMQLARTLDDGLRRGVCSVPKLANCAERLESGPGRHMSVIRGLLAERGVGFHPGGSDSELRVLRVARTAGVSLPIQQYPVTVEGKRYELDYAWPEKSVFAEYYGLDVRSLPSAVAHDNERLTALVADGWTPLVFTDATSDRTIAKRLHAALAGADVGGATHRLGA